MKRYVLGFLVVHVFVLGLSSVVVGDIIVFDDKADFLSATGATEAANFDDRVGGTYNATYDQWNMGRGFAVGDLQFDSESLDFWVGEWTGLLAGDELAISGPEDMDVTVINLGGDVFSLGFEFVEPSGAGTNVPLAERMDSTFAVSLFSGGTSIDSFSFNAPDDQAAFIGIWSYPDQGFDSVQIRETIGTHDNEYFGEFYLGAEPVPVPGAVLLGILGLGAVGVRLRKFA